MQKINLTEAQQNRVLEALKAIADPEHCLTSFTVAGLRSIARAALDELDPANDYSSVHIFSNTKLNT